ncbi:hypothetical protein CDAR_611531 [Caerostris darwini]|uniref:Uncharacterized protein n=1 Tax=Caerostris darwini TaxID=1538125 RepID=A0AAV4U2N8_9ARAC|nr:hypothetical protein CDAR_611531 [Caerostris darwini]
MTLLILEPEGWYPSLQDAKGERIPRHETRRAHLLFMGPRACPLEQHAELKIDALLYGAPRSSLGPARASKARRT